MEQYRYGKHAVEASIIRQKVDKIFLLHGFKDDAILTRIHQAKISVERVEEHQLVKLVQTQHHQGIVAKVKPFAYQSLPTILSNLKANTQPLLLLLDGVEDPQNFGNIIRSAVAFHVDAIIIKKDRQVGVNATVAKVASGALDFIEIVEVTNLSQTMETLKANGYWLVATALTESVDYRGVDYRGPIAIIIGNEGQGISRLVLSRSDFRVTIPIASHIESLNAATSSAVILAEIYRQRFPLKK